MDADRELFIQQLVAALQENAAATGGIASLAVSSQSSDAAINADSSSDSEKDDAKRSSTHTGLFLSRASFPSCGNSERLARDAYVQLQFDYPQVSDASIEALAELYRRISTDKSMWPRSLEVPITATLLDGVAFLHNQSACYDATRVKRSQSSEASGLLAASVLLLVFRTCLEAPEDARVETLLTSFAVGPAEQAGRSNTMCIETMKEKKEAIVEQVAALEDPDDLSEVVEGQLPEPRRPCLPTWNQPTQRATSTLSTTEKLHYLASHTFSSFFERVSVETWEQWRLDDDLIAIIKLLVEQQVSPEAGNNDTRNAATSALYGPRGEWTRYLYILRDRVLQFPGASRNTLWRLKELIEVLPKYQSVATAANTTHHLVYRVLAELSISQGFQQNAAPRARQEMALVIQELIPLIAQEIHQLVTAPKSACTRQEKLLSEHEHDFLAISAGDKAGDDELAVVVLQLLHFMLRASSNARKTTENLHEGGMLRTLLMLLPSTCDSNEEQYTQVQDKRWFPALVRLLGECALWHAGFTAYLGRVPKFIATFWALREQLVVDQLLLALAFHQHNVQMQTTSTSRRMEIWEVFTSESLFPLQCESYRDAMKKLQDTVFLLECLEKVLASLRPAMQKELQRSLQQIYPNFGRSFEYPTFAVADEQRQHQRLKSQALGDDTAQDHGAENKDKKEERRGQTESLQFTALRNKLRQSVKCVLTALSSGSTMARVRGRVSSKLD